MDKRHLALMIASLAWLSGCDKLPFGNTGKGEPPPATDAAPKAQVTDPGVLALVNGTPIAVDIYRRRVNALPEDDARGFATAFGTTKVIHRRPHTAEERAQFLDELVKEELAVQEALSLGLDRDATTKQRLEDARRLILLGKLNERILEGTEVATGEVEEFYQKNQVIFKQAERIRVRQLVVPDMKQAEALRATIVGGADFAELARQHSTGAGKEQGGEVGWYVRELDRQLATLSGTDLQGANAFFPQLEPVAFALDVGQVSQPVKGPEGGYYLVRVEERQPEVVRPLTEVSDQLKQGLLFQKQQQKVQEYFERLWDKNKTKVERNERRLQHEV